MFHIIQDNNQSNASYHDSPLVLWFLGTVFLENIRPHISSQTWYFQKTSITSEDFSGKKVERET